MYDDEIFNRKLYKLREDLNDYISQYYLKEISTDYLNDLLIFLEKWDKDEHMLDSITMALAIEGELSISEIDEYKINREVSRVLFDIYIENILENTNFRDVKTIYANNIKKIYRHDELRGLVKGHLVDNVRGLYSNGIAHLNDFTLYVCDDEPCVKVTIYDPKEVLKIVEYDD
ncbi:MAG: hypothetical protein ACRC6T_17655 [Sarcina sp.]